MKREFLEGLGIEKDIVDKVMAENGKDIEKAKKDYETLGVTVSDLEVQLEDANKQIEGFKGMDIDEIKKNAKEYKEKFEKNEKESKEKIAQLKYEHGLASYVDKFEFVSDRVKKSIIEDLKSKEFKLEDGNFLGADEYMEKLKENEPTSFAVVGEKDVPDIPRFVRPAGNPSDGGIDKETFAKMSYMEKLKIKQTDGKLYKQLNE